jgi:hypothetical protein
VTFTVSFASTAPVLLAPSGQIDTLTPTFTWQPTSTANSYTLEVADLHGTVYTSVYTPAEAGCSGNTGTCSGTPAIALSAPNNYTWTVSATTPVMTLAPAQRMAFSTHAVGPAPPPAPVPIAPGSSATTLTPLFSWNASSTATSYYLLAQNTAGVAISISVTAREAGCGGGTGTCQFTPATALTPGATYVWFVNATNEYGTSEWSRGTTFTVNVVGPSVPQPPVLDSPSGTLGTVSPNFRWNPSAGATSYELIVQNTMGVAVNLTVSSEVANCQSGMCGIVASTPLAHGTAYNWFVRASNSLGTSAWSAGRSITAP